MASPDKSAKSRSSLTLGRRLIYYRSWLVQSNYKIL